MTEETGNFKMTIEAFFDALASNQDFIYAVAYTNSFKKVALYAPRTYDSHLHG